MQKDVSMFRESLLRCQASIDPSGFFGSVRARALCCIAVATICGNGVSEAAPITTFEYPVATGQALLSDKYDVYVQVGTEPERKLQTLMADINDRTHYQGDWMATELKDRTFSFVQLDYDSTQGKVLNFRVVKRFGTAATKVRVAPNSYKLDAALAGGMEAKFVVRGANRYLSVDFSSADNRTVTKGWVKHMLCVFVDPPEQAKPQPTDSGVVVYRPDVSPTDLAAAKVIYFQKGYHNLKDFAGTSPIDERGILTLKSGQGIYLEGGAFVEGVVRRTAYQDSKQKVWGRGILTGRRYFWKNHPDYAANGGTALNEIHQLIEVGTDAEISGIMYMESPNHGITGQKVSVKNVKFLGWHSNNDGIRVGEGSVVSHRFLRAVDDHFYNFKVHVHDCVLWAGHNGAILTYGWGGDAGGKTYNSGGSLLENVDIIHPEWMTLGNNNGLVASQTGLDYKPYGYGGSALTILRNIRIEGGIPGLLNLKPRSSGSGEVVALKVANGSVGYLGDLLLENVQVDSQIQLSRLKGALDASPDGTDYLVRNVEMREVRIGKTCIQSSNVGRYFEIDAATTKDLRYSCSTAGRADWRETLPGARFLDHRNLVFSVEVNDPVRWRLLDLRGRKVREGVHHPSVSGIQVVSLGDAATLPGGIYRAVLLQGLQILSESSIAVP
jgi:hypothetical protein